MAYYTELQQKGHSSNQKLVPLVFTELHVNMGHLDNGRTLQVMRDCFYRPKMEDEVTHVVIQTFAVVSRERNYT